MKKIDKYFVMWASVWALYMVLVVAFFVLPRIQTENQKSNSLSYLIFTPVSIESTFQARQYFSLNKDISLASIYKAQSFYSLSEDERELVESIVCGEAGNQPYWGKVAVASCILNACLKDDIRPREVQTKYQYSGWKSLAQFELECIKAYGNTNLADEVRQAVSQVFDDGEVLSADVLWFYNPAYGYSSFHESQNYLMTIGEHRFFSEKEE